MTTLSDSQRARQPKGAPTGGQYAAMNRAEADLDLGVDGEPTPDWGHLNIQAGSRTPWGPAQTVYQVADGFVEVSCAGHGGIKLSPERNKMIPPALRNPSGWYEEDCESAIPMAYFPNEYAHHRDDGTDSPDRYTDPEFVREDSIARIRNWFPDQYAKATGETVTPEQSYILRERQQLDDIEAFRDAHRTDMVENGGAPNFDGMPAGYTCVRAKRASTGEERVFLVPYEKKSDRGGMPRIIDEKTTLDVTDVHAVPFAPAPRPPLVRPQFDTSGLTAAARERAERELNTRYRFGDGSIKTLRENLESQEVKGRSWYADSQTGRGEYRIELEGNYIRPVSKAVFDAAVNLPDNSNAGEKERAALIRAQNALEKTQGTYNSNFAEHGRQIRAAQAKVEKARAAYKPIEDADIAERKRQGEDYRRRQRETFQRLVDQSGITFGE